MFIHEFLLPLAHSNSYIKQTNIYYQCVVQRPAKKMKEKKHSLIDKQVVQNEFLPKIWMGETEKARTTAKHTKRWRKNACAYEKSFSYSASKGNQNEREYEKKIPASYQNINHTLHHHHQFSKKNKQNEKAQWNSVTVRKNKPSSVSNNHRDKNECLLVGKSTSQYIWYWWFYVISIILKFIRLAPFKTTQNNRTNPFVLFLLPINTSFSVLKN